MANNQQPLTSSTKRKVSSSATTNGVSGPTGEDWARRLQEVDLSKSDLNRLVLDYLIVEGYQTAAEEFVRESGVLDSAGGGGDDKMDQDGGETTSVKKATLDLEGIQERMSIRKAIESGRVEEAIRRVNELDPEILDLHPHLIFHLHLLHLYELLLAQPSTSSSNGTTTTTGGTNLSSTLLFASETLAPLALSSPSHLAELEDALSLLLVLPHANAGNANSNAEAVGGGGGLSKQERREKVAKELNAAILEGQGRGCESKLVGVWRCLRWGEGELVRK